MMALIGMETNTRKQAQKHKASRNGFQNTRIRHQPLKPIEDWDIIAQKPNLTKLDLNQAVVAIFSIIGGLLPS